jgi:hypothetical protein
VTVLLIVAFVDAFIGLSFDHLHRGTGRFSGSLVPARSSANLRIGPH